MIARNSPLRHRDFRHLFAAQILSLVGVGVMTVSLSLTAFEAGGTEAGGTILGGILALKMIAYVLIAPLAETVLSRRPRRATLVTIDILRLGMVALMGFAFSSWQIAALAFVFFAISSGFTPLFQSVLPDLLEDEDSYSRALALSRIAYTLESILSPIIAATALKVITADGLFFLASSCFLGSAVFLFTTRFPAGYAPRKAPFLERVSKGMRIYALTPRLRGLFMLNFALSLSMAWVLVNTVVFAGGRLGDAEHYYTLLMTCYGAGAALGATTVPRLVRHLGERRCMAAGAFLFAGLGLVLSLVPGLPVPGLMPLWGAFGLASSLVLTPGGLVLARSARRDDRPAVFAAQFSLSHAGWLLAYPLAGWLGAAIAPEHAMGVLALATIGATLLALRIWPAEDPLAKPHSHPELPADHPHLRDHPALGDGHRHEHDFHIDELHRHWPQRA
ncbi:MFS transporter (plasmid) [Salipiger sp. H15]|uniref:MFS transporter n=1 Tax=Alloyangia sp. H15 TaxID=3029062 RepID=A0AAU8AQA8_9RHOB